MWRWSMKLKLKDKKSPGWKDLKVNIIEVNAFEDKEFWRQGKWSWSLRMKYKIRFEVEKMMKTCEVDEIMMKKSGSNTGWSWW